jgi:hypothetical protein
VDDPSWVDEVVSEPSNRAVLLLARLMVNRNDSLAWAGLTVLEPNIGPTFRKAIYDSAAESGTRFAEALLAAHADDFDFMTGAAPRRAKDLIDRTLAWLDAHPVPEGDDVEQPVGGVAGGGLLRPWCAWAGIGRAHRVAGR